MLFFCIFNFTYGRSLILGTVTNCIRFCSFIFCHKLILSLYVCFQARAFANLGDCYEALGDFEEAVKWHEQCLVVAQQLGNLANQDKAYRYLSTKGYRVRGRKRENT